MQKRTYLLALVMGGVSAGPRASAESHLMRYADVHDDTIVFTYEGDLWLVPTTGGDARRITKEPMTLPKYPAYPNKAKK